jgi:PleD family two-component response regulator
MEIQRFRLQLQLAIRESGLPTFTASFGVTPAFLAEDLDLLLARADAALFEAKRGGRDRIVASAASDLDDAGVTCS